jgi:YVTN family beta-propeller protein
MQAQLSRSAVLLVTPLLFAAGTYHAIATYPVGGEPGWDYINIDSGSRRLYVSHVSGLEVLDADTGKLIGRIADTPGVHGIALASEFGKGFVGNGKAGTVSVIDLKTLLHLTEIPAGKKPDAIVYDPGTRKVIVANAESNSVTIIDAAHSKAEATIDIGGAPEYIATDLKGTAWVNIADKDALAVIDIKSQRLVRTAPLEGCKEPTALAIDRQKARLFVGCRNKVMTIVDAATLKVLARLPIGDHVDAAEFDDESGVAFASTGDGVLTMIRETAPAHFEIVGNVQTMRTAKTMVLDRKTKKIFLPAVENAPPEATGPPKASGPGSYQAGRLVVLVLAK